MLRESEFCAPFYSWSWYDAWWKHFAEGNELFLVAGEAPDGRLQFLAPLMKGKRSLRGLPVSEISFLANSISPRSSILFGKDCAGPDALGAVLTCLAEQRSEWDMVRLWNIPEGMSYLPCFDEAGGRHRFHVIREPGWQSAYVAMEGNFETYMAGNFGKNRRRGIQQKVRQLSARPGYRIRDFKQPDEVQQGLDLAFAVSRASWKGKLGTDMAGEEARRSFYTDITRRLAERGQVRIWISFLDETPLALHYDLVDSDTAYLIVNDFSDEHQAVSPGTVLLYQVIERMYREKLGRFQFSGDIYDYKSKWASGFHRHVTLEVFHNRPYSRLLWWTKNTALPALRSVKANLWAASRKVEHDEPAARA
jgi:CelD/BcsL family acetyltransferase involved in cellulose biosynthesis